MITRDHFAGTPVAVLLHRDVKSLASDFEWRYLLIRFGDKGIGAFAFSNDRGDVFDRLARHGAAIHWMAAWNKFGSTYLTSSGEFLLGVMAKRSSGVPI